MISYFDNLSKYYYLNEYLSFGLTAFHRKQLVNKISSYEGKNILDIMSGRGENLKFLKSNKQHIDITTIDYSKGMSKNSLVTNPNQLLRRLQLDFFNYETEDCYDVILCSFGIKTLPKQKLKTFAEKLSTMLSNNGEILLLEISVPTNPFVRLFLKTYLNHVLPLFFGKKFHPLFSYIQRHKNMKDLKKELLKRNLNVIEHKVSFFSFELLHLKNGIT